MSDRNVRQQTQTIRKFIGVDPAKMEILDCGLLEFTVYDVQPAVPTCVKTGKGSEE